MKRKNKLKITDEMIGSDPFGTCCSTIADKMIIAREENSANEEVTGELASLSQVNKESSKGIKKNIEK